MFICCCAFIICLMMIIVIIALTRVHLISPVPTPLFEDRTGMFISEGYKTTNELGYWDVPGIIPERMARAILVIEDKRFYHHWGVDVKALCRATWNNMYHKKHEGASTIAMQVARMQYPARRNIWNKCVELCNAYFLTMRYGRGQILRHYMKIVPQGNQIHGFVYAARRFFKKPLKDISWAEASVLAGLPKSPGKMNLFTVRGFLKAVDRAQVVLRLLYQEKIIDEEEYRSNLKALQELEIPTKELRPDSCYHYILRLLNKYDTGEQISYKRPVRTTLDLKVQHFLSVKAMEAMNKYRSYGAGNISLMVVDKITGDVLGYVGSEYYFDEINSGSINYAYTPRSSGSTIKPFIFAKGLADDKFSPASIIADLPLHIIKAKGEYYARNFDDNYLGPMIYRRALANSRNIPAVRVLEKIGLDDTYEFLHTLKLHNKEKSLDHYGYGIALGGLYVTLEDLVRAYGVLANEGRNFDFRWQIHDEKPDDGEILPAHAARRISLFLADPLARLPSFRRLNALEMPFPVAVKTGTSQGYKDAWAIAYSARYIVGVWMGHPDNQGMNHITGSVSAEFVKDIFLYLQPGESNGINEVPFPAPRGYVPVKICSHSGKIVQEDCPAPALEYFEKNTAPYTGCDFHQRVAIDKQTGFLATSDTPIRRITTKAFVVLPPQYAAWGARQGYGLPPTSSQDKEVETKITILEPPQGGRYIIDPETPAKFQTLALRAEVVPAIEKIVWYIDGKEFCVKKYPYEARWPLTEGVHYIQAKFPHANVVSDKIKVIVSSYY